jgi:hypothetical protein
MHTSNTVVQGLNSLPRKFKGVWIPADLWMNRELSITDKVMLVEISSLESDDRGCYASNAHFAKFFDLSVKRVSNIINDLARDGILSVSLIREGNRVVERQLRIMTPLENFHTPLENEANPSRKGNEPPLGKVKGSNTKILSNTKRENGAGAPTNYHSFVEFNGEDFSVSDDLITKWSLAYSPVDVEAEIVRAAAWASGSPTKKDWRRFLVNWLGRAHKKSGSAVDESNIPVDQIIALYHKVCPNLPVVTVPGDKVLRSMIVERWNESPDHQSGQNFWLGFFQKANSRNQVFFRGQNVAPRLEALVSRAVFREISEAAQ